MSKSLGTGIDPIELIDRHGADATRFGLLANSSTQDVRFSEEKIAQGAQLTNKLFNASRLILLNVGDTPPAPAPGAIEDRWILSRLQRAKAEAAERLAAFDFAKLALGLYDFVFGELCDWYLELVKPRLYDGDEAARATAGHVLRETLALAHPVIPFVTEELWELCGEDALLAGARVPAVDDALTDPGAEAAVGAAIETIRAVRGWRESLDAPPSLRLNATVDAPDDVLPLIARMARLDAADGAVVATVPAAYAVAVHATDGLDVGAAERRRDAERTRLEGEVRRAEGKLANAGFVAKAPEAVVAAERAKLDRLRAELAAL
jgi:valyl-tRNA synthetase